MSDHGRRMIRAIGALMDDFEKNGKRLKEPEVATLTSMLLALAGTTNCRRDNLVWNSDGTLKTRKKATNAK